MCEIKPITITCYSIILLAIIYIFISSNTDIVLDKFHGYYCARIGDSNKSEIIVLYSSFYCYVF